MNNLEQQLRSVISDRDLVKLLNLIIAEQDGSYIMFGKYHIHPENGAWRIQSNSIQKTLVFSTLKSATAYCIFHHALYITDSQTLEVLDTRLAGQENTLAIYNKMMKKYSNSSKFGIYAAKKQECELHIKLLREQISQYHSKSRDLQLRKFRAYQINTI